MTLMPKEQRRKVYEAEMLLREAGVHFDNGSGEGSRDWELDWSLSGALVEGRPLQCKQCKKPLLRGKVCWGDFSGDPGAYSEPFCSPQHLEQRKATILEKGDLFLGIELVSLTPSPLK